MGAFLEQHSADLRAGQALAIKGAKFRVIATQPQAGGGACVDTTINTTGLPAKSCATPGCDGAPAGKCRAPDCKRFVCKEHAVEVREASCLCPLHAPKPAKRGLLSFLP